MQPGAARISTPVGTLRVSVSGDGAARVDWAGDPAHTDAWATPAARVGARALKRPSSGIDARASSELAASLRRWIGGDRDALDGAPLPSGTAWQAACWRAARRIGYGETRTYLWLAREACRDLGKPASAAPSLARAAGQAMRRNPAPIVVPCHRVVSASGLGGYSGTEDPGSPELARKRWLLEIEARRARDPVDLATRRAAGQ